MKKSSVKDIDVPTKKLQPNYNQTTTKLQPEDTISAIYAKFTSC